MSGLWQAHNRPVKKPKIKTYGQTVVKRHGKLYMIPLNRKAKQIWEMARYIGEAPENLPDVVSNVELSDNEEYAEDVEVIEDPVIE